MAKLPRDADIPKVLEALERLGFRIVYVSGSHYKRVYPPDPSRFATVPFHGKMPTGTLRSILRSARVSLEEFLKVFASCDARPYHKGEPLANVEIASALIFTDRIPAMRTPPRTSARTEEGELPYPIETLRFWYVSPFGGRSLDLASDQVGLNRQALAKNTELDPEDRVAIGLPGSDPDRPWFFQEQFEIVPLDERHKAANLSPSGEVVLPERAYDFVRRPDLQPRVGDAVVLKATAAKQLAVRPEWLAELLRKSVRRPNF